jgi:branched-chain amino acid transport system permease protein
MATVIISGLLLGSLYAMIAQGLNLIWGVLRVVNFAYGEFLMLGCYISFSIVTFCHADFLVTPLFSFLSVGVLGLCIFTGFIKPMLGKEELEFNSLLLLFGFSLIITTAARLIWSATYRIVPAQYGKLGLGPILVPLNYLLAFLISLVVTLMLYLFLQRTYLGKSVRAVVQNKESAAAIGINPNLVYGVSFFIGCGVAAVGGSLVSLVYSIYPDMGFPFTILSFCIVCMGGLGNFWGVFASGLIVGVVEVFVGTFAGAQWEPIVVVALLLLLLISRQVLGRK